MMGYESSQMVRELQQRAARASAAPPPAGPPYAAQPHAAPRSAPDAPTVMLQNGIPSGPSPGAGYADSGPAWGPGPGAYGHAQGNPGPASYNPGNPGMSGMPPVMPGAPIMPAYGGHVNAASYSVGRRPLEPFRQGLMLVMIAFGILLLGAFATPLATKPELSFWWNVLLDGEGLKKVEPIRLVGVGGLALLLGVLPLSAAIRGLFATLLGAALIALPIAVTRALPDWRVLAPLAGMIILVTGLLLRFEYRESVWPRILATIGALAVLAAYVVPEGDLIPLVGLVESLGDNGMERVIPQLVLILLVVVCFGVWRRSPSGAGAKFLAWCLILYSIVPHALAVAASEGFPDGISATPFPMLMEWVSGCAALGLLGYGLASMLGKTLE